MIICVSWPIGPTGVVSVSPVTRQATKASTNDSHPIGDIKAALGQIRQGDQGHELAYEEPLDGGFDCFQRVFRFVSALEHLAQVAEGTQ